MTIGGAEAAFTAFVTAALVMVLLMFGLSATIATAQEHIVGTLRANMVQVKRWGGTILILIGIWLIILGFWANAFAQLFPV